MGRGTEQDWCVGGREREGSMGWGVAVASEVTYGKRGAGQLELWVQQVREWEKDSESIVGLDRFGSSI